MPGAQCTFGKVSISLIRYAQGLVLLFEEKLRLLRVRVGICRLAYRLVLLVVVLRGVAWAWACSFSLPSVELPAARPSRRGWITR